MLIRTAAVYHEFPSIGQASLALPTFPRGNAAYAYGSMFVDYLARTRGDSSIRKFVESSSNQLIPFLIEVPAKRAFRTTFTSAWKEWQKSVEAALPPLGPPTDGWRELTTDGLLVSSPRWRGDSSLTYTGTGGRDSYGAYEVSLSGKRTRLGRRNSPSPTVKLADGSFVFSQLELTGPYAERSDLFVQRGGHQERLTTNARLFSPDTRSDGAIIATQIVEGASRLVRVSGDGTTITPITSGTFDTLWSEPRWSNNGDRIAAVRWFRGGVSQIVVIDTLGAVRHIATSGRFSAASPSWLPADSGIVYTIGDGARNDVYLQYFDPSGARSPDSRGAFVGPSYRTLTYRVIRSDLGAFEPQVKNAVSPNRILMAAVELRGNGYRLGVADRSRGTSPGEVQAPTLDDTPDPRLPALAVDSSPATQYSALRTLIPRYWVPLFDAGIDANTYRVGGYTEGWDILRRHYVYAGLRIPTDNSGIDAAAEYQYKGFGLPIVTFDARQDWSNYATIVSRANPNVTIGTVRRRIKDAQFLATFLRQRVRSSFSLSAGAGVERREYLSVPDTLLPRLDTTRRFDKADFPRLMLSTGYAAYQSPSFSISPEDGFTIAATARDRIRSSFNATGGSSLSFVSSATAYKSLDLPGYAHHVLAIRGSGGWADTKAGGYYEVGGASGGSFQIIPGYTVGEGRQTFPVRGFQPATLIGVRALSGSAEYRAPLSLTHRSLGVVPAFLNRSSLSLFGDYGVAWCPTTATNRQVCTSRVLETHTDIASVGAELNVNAGVLSWDSPSHFRLGFAVPIRNRLAVRARVSTVYLTSGLSF